MILSPQQALEAGPDRVGGKAYGLARLSTRSELAVVPPWFVIDGAVSLGHLGRSGHLERSVAILTTLSDDTSRAELESASEELRSLVLQCVVEAGLQRDITKSLSELGPGPYAVRSSMVGEDASDSSWAGQLESFLYVAAADVADKVRHCWASAFTAHALAYRAQREHAELLPRVAVVVQQMVTGDVSGVAFTADPTTGRRDRFRIAAAWGLAEGIVSGACNTDEFVLSHAFDSRSSAIADKDIMVVRADGGGTEEVPTPEDLREQPCLNAQQVDELVGIGIDLAEEFGHPLDLEWTRDDTGFQILQARPITALPAVENSDGPRTVFDNSNIQESYCGVTTPLTFSFAQSAYASVYRQTMEALGLPDDVIADHDDMLRNMLGLVRGRVYYNINNWYRGLLLLPSFGRNKEDMEAMMGLDVPVDFVEDQEFTLSEKLAKLPRMLTSLVRLLWRFRQLDSDVPRFLADFEAAYERANRARFADASFSELTDVVAQMRREILENWSTPIINDFYVMMSVGKLRRLVESAGVEHPGDVVNNLMSGEEGIESLEPTRRLMQIAKRAGDSADVRQTLQAGEPRAAFEALRDEQPAFFAEIEQYIERYGDRVIGELKLETITAREDPSFVIQVLRNFVSRPDLDPSALAAHEAKLREQAEDQLRGKLSAAKLRKVLGTARTAVKYRENMRLARTRLFGLFRDAYRAMGQRLVEAGKLSHPRDIFYLTTGELLAYQEGRAVSADLQPIVDARRAEYERYETMPLPHHFETVGPVYHGNGYEGPHELIAYDADTDVLSGTGCYPGTVEAPLSVVMSPTDDLDLTGKILTTMRTDPGWAPLFPAASGILVERGSTLSHSAVVARELGIPAVVGVPGLLQAVEHGEQVVLDGAAGTVTRVARRKEA